MALNGLTEGELSLQQAREADPALMSDAELAYALDWMLHMRDSLCERVVVLSAAHVRRRHGAQEGARHATYDNTSRDGDDEPHLPGLFPCPPDRPPR